MFMSTRLLKSERELLAFVHIEKAAGTTLNHILRVNFAMRYCDVKPLSSASKGIFRAEDMRKVMAINPAVKCISGHSIKPFVDLCEVIPRIRYITLLRQPVYRYISQYQYWIETLDKKLSFDQFMNLKSTFNFQTRKIAGTEDLCLAKDILAKRFFLVGIVEEFDQFLMLLKRKLEPFNFRAGYQLQNIGDKESTIRREITQNIDEYRDKIMEVNQLDTELYRYVREELIPREKEQYGRGFENDLTAFRNSRKNYPANLVRYADYLFRKCYYEPIFGFIRKLNGLPAKGSY